MTFQFIDPNKQILAMWPQGNIGNPIWLGTYTWKLFLFLNGVDISKWNQVQIVYGGCFVVLQFPSSTSGFSIHHVIDCRQYPDMYYCYMGILPTNFAINYTSFVWILKTGTMPSGIHVCSFLGNLPTAKVPLEITNYDFDLTTFYCSAGKSLTGGADGTPAFAVSVDASPYGLFCVSTTSTDGIASGAGRATVQLIGQIATITISAFSVKFFLFQMQPFAIFYRLIKSNGRQIHRFN